MEDGKMWLVIAGKSTAILWEIHNIKFRVDFSKKINFKYHTSESFASATHTFHQGNLLPANCGFAYFTRTKLH